MSDYRIVIADPDVAHASERARGLRLGEARAAGTVHVERIASECPDGRPNCRDCGDPEYAEACATAGHCPYCGTRHGIAPQRILTANGYRLEGL